MDQFFVALHAVVYQLVAGVPAPNQGVIYSCQYILITIIIMSGTTAGK
jgi:hypothetical protein